MRKEFIVTQFGLEALRSLAFQDIQSESDPEKKKSLFGVPIWSNLVLPAANYEDLQGNVISLRRVEIDSVLFSVSQRKNIVVTPVQGRDGTVKEYVSAGDYQVSIFGSIVGEQSEVYPEAEVLDLLTHIEAPVSLKVQSEYLSLFGIDEIVITDYRMPQRRGYHSFQPFSINALSDAPIELTDLNGV